MLGGSKWKDEISKLLVESDAQTLKDIQLDTKIYSFLSVSVCTNADTREWARQGSIGPLLSIDIKRLSRKYKSLGNGVECYRKLNSLIYLLCIRKHANLQ